MLAGDISPVTLHLSWPEPAEVSHDEGPGANRRFFDAPISFVHVPEETLNKAMGLAVMVELPLVVIDVQRAGPSTGMPTKNEQADLLQVMFGRNSDSPVPIVAPATPVAGGAVAGPRRDHDQQSRP